jgi:2,3-bisphosphoglycerate-dependent phosphoglycerate mutase
VSTPRPQYRQSRFRRPPAATELLLVRHGESQPAVPGEPFPLVDGHGDPALAPEGRAQAEAVAERLAPQRLDAIYVTSLRRTAETAAPLVARLGVEVRIEPDLREVHLGEWEGGVFRQKVAEGDPLAARMYAEQRWDVIPGAEPQDAFAGRVRAAIERIVAAHPDQRVAVFSHGGTIGQVLHLAVGGDRPFAFVGCDNGSVSHLVVANDRWIVRRFNDTAHLHEGFDLDPAPHLPEGGTPNSGFST